MSCGRARRLLWPDAGPREASAEVLAAREHAAGCEACRDFFQDMRRMSERIGYAAPRPTAPPDVRNRLFKAIAEARTVSRPARGTGFRAAAAALVIALVTGLGLLGYLAVRGGMPGGDDPLRSIVADQVRSRRGAAFASADSVEVARWLAERLPFAVQVPLFPDARLTGARLLVDARQSGAVLEYATQGRLLTYYVLPGSGTDLPRRIQLAARDGYRVASWHDAGLTHALVAALPDPKLIEYARYCIHQMTASASVRHASRYGAPHRARSA
jgi:hypothetical protein